MPATYSTTAYRPEIQGLRTIGALLVAVFHIWLGKVSGGVDVFFVISGFLITGSLYRELERTRTIDVFAFWGRIAARLAPVGYVVLALTLVAAFLWMPGTRWEAFVSEVLYSAAHLENIKLMMNSVDYLARTEPPSPVQQFWALSLQVQFYALWPFALLGAGFLAARMRFRPAAYGLIIGAVVIASFAYAIRDTAVESQSAYFNPLGRAWEFALGGLVAVVGPYLALPAAIRSICGWVGLALVISCGFVIPTSMPFPGYAALMPTGGAVLVLLSGGPGTRFGVARLLASKPLVSLGNLAFSFYLWHWPVLVFYLILIGKSQAGPRGGLGIIAVALAGAYLTNRCVEQPIMRRFKDSKRRWRGHAVAAAFALPVIAVASVSVALVWGQDRDALGSVGALIVDGVSYPGGLNPVSPEGAFDPAMPIYPSPAAAKRLPKGFRTGCHQTGTEAEVITCSYGVQDNFRKIIAVVGGSHSVHWLPAFEVLAAEHAWHIVSITKSACPFEAGTSRRPSCIQWNADIVPKLTEIKPDVVFTTSTRSDLKSGDYADGSLARSRGRAETIPRGYLKQWARLAENGIAVVAVRDNPRFDIDVPECMERASSEFMNCARPRSRLLDLVDPTSDLNGKPANVEFIDLTDRFCDDSFCYPVNGNVLIYRDKHHLSTAYAQTLARVLGERMRQVRPDLFDEPVSERQR